MTFDQYNRNFNELQKFQQIGENKTAVRVNDSTVSTNKLAISAESVSFAVGAAGTTGVVTLDKAPIYNVDGGFIGRLGDTSFAWITGTILITEVAYLSTSTDTAQLAVLAQGEYAMDYDNGRIRYCKKTNGTSDTCNYTSRQLNIEITGGTPTLSIGSTKIEDASTSSQRALVKAGNTFGAADNAIGVADANVLGALAASQTPITLTGGNKTVAVSGTGEVLGAALATKSIYIRASAINTGNVFVGDLNVDAVTSQQIILAANDSVTLNIANRSTVYVDVAVGGEGVDYMCMS